MKVVCLYIWEEKGVGVGDHTLFIQGHGECGEKGSQWYSSTEELEGHHLISMVIFYSLLISLRPCCRMKRKQCIFIPHAHPIPHTSWPPFQTKHALDHPRRSFPLIPARCYHSLFNTSPPSSTFHLSKSKSHYMYHFFYLFMPQDYLNCVITFLQGFSTFFYSNSHSPIL